MKLRAGYKVTDIGLMPLDWRIVNLGDVSVISRLAGAEYTSLWHETPTGEIIALRGFNIGQGKIVDRDFVRITNSLSMKLKRSRLCKGDVVYPCVGSIGNALVIDEDNKYHIQQNIARITPDSMLISSHYLANYLMSFLGAREVERFNSSSSQPSVLVGNLRQYRIALPPTKAEQEVIASHLSDVDALIVGLEKLIAKKRDLKQAAMQQLLTGQTRLPGFSGQWVKRTLGEIGEISGAGVDKKIRFGEQPVRLLNYMDVYKRTFLKSSDFSHEVSAKPDQIRRCNVKVGDVFFTPTSEVREDIGHSAVALEDMPDVAYSYHVVRLRIFDGWDPTFSAYPFQTKSFLDQASTTCEGSGTRYVITLPKFRALEVLYPADKREQAAIASVLFDMDAEIVALETRLAKTCELKQGMMQELLTGRTRLV
jgi:type I restriction enzyme S subunit